MTKIFTPLIVVAAALADGEGRWLMHRRPDHKQHGGLWEFPGGKVEPGESPRQALVREMVEEASLLLEECSLQEAGFAVGQAPDGADGIVILLYTGGRWRGELASPEGGTFEWFLPQEIDGLSKPPLDVVLARQLFRNAG